MEQYLKLLRRIKESGTWKEAARANMPRTLSLFGYQFHHDLQDGFPLLTTKKLSFKNIVVELLWFLRGDTNIQFLMENNCNIWNEDAYNYYIKLCKKEKISKVMSFDYFVETINDFTKHQDRVGKSEYVNDYKMPYDYELGDCGKQYGWLWRNWNKFIEVPDVQFDEPGNKYETTRIEEEQIDQLENLIQGFKTNPEGRRHIITAWNPATLDDMALNACHALVQFNCRPLDLTDKTMWYDENPKANEEDCPQYYLDCQMYQRSADVFLGVPYNIASYSLLTHILAKICNMIPGQFVHTFGDVHIYENHMDAVNEQLLRETRNLPELIHGKSDNFWKVFDISLINHLEVSDFWLENYNPQPSIKAKLSTGLQ